MSFHQDVCVWDGRTPSNRPGSKSAGQDAGVLAGSGLNTRERRASDPIAASPRIGLYQRGHGSPLLSTH